MKKHSTLIIAALSALAVSAQDTAPAFPGAEGFGRYTQGGRGGVIKHVTNLNDSGSGSLREAVNGSSKKIVVFDVSGVIELKSDLKIGANTTIAGQTAPGDGITVRYYTVRPNGNNIIVRFMRFRRGQEVDVNDGADAIWCRNYTNIVIDHCSVSWSIDELASFYDNRDFSMQWCTLGEALANPGHSKGEHSYGGIWGGKGASFHHNFLAHMQNRVPRFNGARYSWEGYDKTLYPNTVQAERVDFRNCVMYNWGTGGCYGGPGGGYINIVNNYYKAGPGTANKTRVTQVSVNSSGNGDSSHPELYDLTSRYFIDGNYVASASKPANYDWQGVAYDSGLINDANGVRWMKDVNFLYPESEENKAISSGGQYVPVALSAPIDAAEVTTHTAENAYLKVLDFAGASFARDAVDTRYMDEARTGTTHYKGSIVNRAGIIDVVADQGEYILASESRPADWDSDGDGMPDSWEIANGLNPTYSGDAKQYTIDAKGWYTNVEVYINSLVEPIIKAQNEDAISAVDEYYPAYIDPAGISDINADTEVVATEYYTPDGRRISNPAPGINLRRLVRANGSVLTEKIVIR